MTEKEVRLMILKILHEFYNDKPYDFLEKKNLMEKFSSKFEEKIIDRNIKYLSDKGFIKVHNLLGGNFLAQLTVDGIDFLESEG